MAVPPYAPQAPQPHHIPMGHGHAFQDHSMMFDHMDHDARGSPHSTPIVHNVTTAFAAPPRVPITPTTVVGQGQPEYRGWTFTALDPGDGAKTRWAKVHKARMGNTQPELAAMVKREKEKGISVQKKLMSNDMAGHKRAQVEQLLADSTIEELDRQYEWKLAMIRLNLRRITAKKFETTAMHVIVKGVPASGSYTVRPSGFDHHLPGEVVDLNAASIYHEDRGPVPHPGFMRSHTAPDPRVPEFSYPQHGAAFEEIFPGSHHAHGEPLPHHYHHHASGARPAAVEVLNDHDMHQHNDSHFHAMPEHGHEGHGGHPMPDHGHNIPHAHGMPGHGHSVPNMHGMPGHDAHFMHNMHGQDHMHHMPDNGHGRGGYRDHEQARFEKAQGKKKEKFDGHEQGHGGSKQKKAQKPAVIINQAKEKVSKWRDDSDLSDSDSHRSTFSDNETVLLSPPSSASEERDYERIYEIKPSKHGRHGKDYRRQDPDYRQHGRRPSSKRSSFNSEDYVIIPKHSKARAFAKPDNSRPRHRRGPSDDYEFNKRSGLKIEEKAYSEDKEKERREMEIELARLRQLERDVEAKKERDRDMEYVREIARLEGRIEAFQMEERNQREQDRPIRGGGGRYYDEHPSIGNGRNFEDRGARYGRRALW